ncbi:MAG: T9SS type A sorting domain-containing protein [Flavobacteriales bacterium]
MRKIILFFSLSLAFIYSAQTQIGNSNLEQWENVGAPTEEPVNWNSFKTGSGSFAGFANKQIEQSSNVRAGASGMYCARIWSTSVLGIVANGTMTCGRINMGSATPTNAANYNYSSTADANFSEACVDSPDSIVFWVKYTQAGAGNQTARIHAILHDAFDVHDPIDANSQPHIIATAELNYPATGGNWERKSIPFTYTPNTGLLPGFVLVTFATNSTPGGGAANDEILIDDISLVYNGGVGIDESLLESFHVNYSNDLLSLFGQTQGELSVYSMNGAQVFNGITQGKSFITLSGGMYVARLVDAKGNIFSTKFSVN